MVLNKKPTDKTDDRVIGVGTKVNCGQTVSNRHMVCIEVEQACRIKI